MKRLILLFALLGSCVVARAQVTTSGISGRVSAVDGSIAGATIVARHVPSGSMYAIISNHDGRYTIQGMRVGGPYEVEVAFLGYNRAVVTEVYLKLGETTEISTRLEEASEELQEVVITSTAYRPKAGTSTYVAGKQLHTLPTVNRSITDFTKLSPFSGGNNSFAGRDGRQNNITLDGASLNNSFGLSTNNLPGGDAQPVSLEAIEGISVNVAPYDVKYANFTGAAINTVTKSGHNTLAGAAYTFLRPQAFTGNKVEGIEVPQARTRNSQLYGFTLGGAVVKDKLFFFVNAEVAKQTQPARVWRPSQDGIPNAEQNLSRTSLNDMQRVKEFLINTYGYDPGSYDGNNNFYSNNWKIMAKVDWNFHPKHKATVRVNAVDSKNDIQVNSASAPTSILNRVGQDANAFSNSDYAQRNIVTSITGELNSHPTHNVANKLLATYTHINDVREEKGTPFPFIDIQKDGSQYMSVGTEPFTPHNVVLNNVMSFVDNVNLALGKHYLTAGASFERQYFFNSYLRYPYGYYRYNSVDAFINQEPPTMYALSYGYNNVEVPGVDIAFGLAGAYAQDEWTVNDHFKATLGLRFDMPLYLNKLDGNAAVSQLTFAQGRKVDLSKWPKTQTLASPRASIKWDVPQSNGNVTINAGTGLFAGLIPFVWFTNQPTYSGVIQNVAEPVAGLPDNFPFYTNYKDAIRNHPDLFPTQAAIQVPGSIAFTDPNFKLPQVWRSNLGAEIKLPHDFLLTLNAMYTQEINSLLQVNVNQAPANDHFSGPDQRPFYNNQSRLVNSNLSTAMMLTNGKDKGYQYALSAVVNGSPVDHLNLQLAYTYSQARDLTANPGSSAATVWRNNASVGDINEPVLSYSAFTVPHRISLLLAYDVTLIKNSPTTVGLYYNGTNQGRTSFISYNDLNGDGQNADLIYVPNDNESILFTDIVIDDVVTYSAQQQEIDFRNYINSDKYLKSRKGDYVQRHGGIKPWLNRFDLQLTQAVHLPFLTKTTTAQVSLDIMNVGNLLNNKWGTLKQHGLATTDTNITLLRYDHLNENKQPVYKLGTNSTTNPQQFKQQAQWVNELTVNSTWGMLLGLKVSF